MSFSGGGGTAPAQIPISPAPAPKQAAPVDDEARKQAMQRAQLERLRRGRRDLRIDLASASAGSGIFIPT